MNRKIFKQTLQNIKQLCKTSKTYKELYNSLNEKYERISNQPEKNYNRTYNAVELFKAKTINVTRRKLNDNSIIIFEFALYEKAPNGFLIFCNEFENGLQEEIEIYITQGEKENG
jgi:hypothetical protein